MLSVEFALSGEMNLEVAKTVPITFQLNRNFAKYRVAHNILFFFFLMIRQPPRSTLFPSPTLSQSLARSHIDRQRHVLPRPQSRALDSRRRIPEHRLNARARRRQPSLISAQKPHAILLPHQFRDRKSTRLNSSHLVISYAVFCLKKK